ncbi:MAG: 2-amino-4-hydroxy-6-hydroxymethyldihydropteridine diphosphokinase [Lepagella sp.]
MPSVVLSVGSNVGFDEVKSAVEWLSHELKDFQASTLYRTPALQGVGNPYVNAVVIGKICETCDAFNQRLKAYELSCGRDAAARAAGVVPIDIDIVMKNGEVIRPRDYAHSFFQIGYNQLVKQ